MSCFSTFLFLFCFVFCCFFVFVFLLAVSDLEVPSLLLGEQRKIAVRLRPGDADYKHKAAKYSV